MTNKQAIEYFKDNSNWETVESVPSGTFEVQRLKGTGVHRIVTPNRKMFCGSGQFLTEIPVSKDIFYYEPMTNHDGSLGFKFQGTSVSQDHMVSLVKGALR